MKILEPAITCLLTTHGKPTLGDALHSLARQTRFSDVQVLVIDSGVWMREPTKPENIALAEVYALWSRYPNIEWYLTGEPENARQLYCPVAHWTNFALTNGLVRGRYFCTFYDDDLYSPEFMATMGGYLDSHPDCEAVRCSERWIELTAKGTRIPKGILRADRVLKKGDRFDGAVDGMQVMMRTAALLRIPYPFLDETTAECRHSDGVFYEKLSKIVPQMDFIDEVLCEHRFTPHSTYTPSKGGEK